MYSALVAKFVAVNRYRSVMASMEPNILPNSKVHHSGASGCSSELYGSYAYK